MTKKAAWCAATPLKQYQLPENRTPQDRLFGVSALTVLPSAVPANAASIVFSFNCIGWPIQAIFPFVSIRKAEGIPFWPAASIQVIAIAPFLSLLLSSRATR